MLNYAGVKTESACLTWSMRRRTNKDRYLPGSRIPVVSESRIREITSPDVVVILPWNLRLEISEQLHYIREWGREVRHGCAAAWKCL